MDELLTVEEVAKILRVHLGSVYRWIENGRIETTRLGSRDIRLTERQVQNFLETRQTKKS